MEKICSKCSLPKEVKYFYKCKAKKDGYSSICKECQNQSSKNWVEKNNPSYHSEYYFENKQKISQQKKEYYQENRDYFLNIAKEAGKRPEVRERNRKALKKFYSNLENVEKNKERLRKFQKEQRQNPELRPLLVLHEHINQSICRAIKFINKGLEYKYKKSNKSLEVMSLDNWDDFKIYIESLWLENMNWSNYGRCNECWSIDHKIPISSARSIDDVIRLNHYTNLQPMWHIENIKKGGINRLKTKI